LRARVKMSARGLLVATNTKFDLPILW